MQSEPSNPLQGAIKGADKTFFIFPIAHKDIPNEPPREVSLPGVADGQVPRRECHKEAGCVGAAAARREGSG